MKLIYWEGSISFETDLNKAFTPYHALYKKVAQEIRMPLAQELDLNLEFPLDQDLTLKCKGL